MKNKTANLFSFQVLALARGSEPFRFGTGLQLTTED